MTYICLKIHDCVRYNGERLPRLGTSQNNYGTETSWESKNITH